MESRQFPKCLYVLGMCREHDGAALELMTSSHHLSSTDPPGGCCDTQRGGPAWAFGCHMSTGCASFLAEAWVGTPKGEHNEQETRKHVELISSSELAFSH